MSVHLSPIADVDLSRMCEALLQADPDIIEIVLFGSAAYAPDLARDVDLLVLTRHKKDEDVYWDAVWSIDVPFNIDVLAREVGQVWGRDIALSVYAVGINLYGDGVVREEAKKFMGVPTYDNARMMPHVAAEVLDMAHHAQNDFRRDVLFKDAFNKLFDAARYAVMTFLASDNTRWGQLAKQLPASFEKRFREIIGVLHVQYHYEGTYPKENTDAEFDKWRGIVNQFIDDLEQDAKAKQTKFDEEETKKEQP